MSSDTGSLSLSSGTVVLVGIGVPNRVSVVSKPTMELPGDGLIKNESDESPAFTTDVFTNTAFVEALEIVCRL